MFKGVEKMRERTSPENRKLLIIVGSGLLVMGTWFTILNWSRGPIYITLGIGLSVVAVSSLAVLISGHG
jgi:hypothetical protein